MTIQKDANGENYQATCQHCGAENHPAMARRYGDCCSQLCEALMDVGLLGMELDKLRNGFKEIIALREAKIASLETELKELKASIEDAGYREEEAANATDVD